MKLYLRTLGEVSVEGAPPAPAGAAGQRKPLALLALIAAAGPRGLQRDQILAYLWPERDEEHARGALRQTLHALRRDLAAPELFLGTGELRLNPELIGSDVAELESAVVAGDPDLVARLYRGPFLEGFHLPEATEFDRWAERQRRHLAQLARQAFESLAARAGGGGDQRQAVRWWRRAAAIEPTDAQLAVGLMRALASAGDRAAALQHARVYETLLREELGASPDRRVVELADQLRRQGTEPAPPPAVPHPAVPQSAAEVPPAPQGEASRRPAGARLRPSRRLVGAGSLAAAAGVLFMLGPAVRERSPLGLQPARVAVAPFRVFEPDLEVWAEGMVDVLSRDLDGAGELSTVAPTVVLGASRGPSDVASARRLGRATGAGIVLVGSLLRAGPDSVQAAATLVDARSGRILGEVGRREALDRMDRLTDSLTVGVLRELAAQTAGPSAAPLPGLHSTSLVALKLFLRAERYYRETRWDSARVLYQRTLAQDSTMALAYRRLGHVLGWERVNFDSAASVLLLRAGELNHGLGRRDSLLVRCDSLTAAVNTTDDPLLSWNLVRQLFLTAGEATNLYPSDPEAWFALGEARYHFGSGPLVSVPETEILQAFDRVIAADSGFAPAYLHPIELALNTRGAPSALRYIRSYLALEPTDASHRGVRLVAALLQPRPHGAELKSLLDTVPAHVLSSARTTLRSWPDSAETAVRLSRLLAEGRPSAYPLFADTGLMRRRLAEQLAFRGHLDEAYRVLGNRESGIFIDLVALGAVPADTARAELRRWLDIGSPYARLALPLWAEQRDSSALRDALRAARGRARTGEDADRFRAGYDTSAALAYLTLLRGDSAGALARLTSLPDSACERCYLDRLFRARLLARDGRLADALTTLEERLVPYSTPFQVVFARERARVAERLGQRQSARQAAGFARQAWRNADPVVAELR